MTVQRLTEKFTLTRGRVRRGGDYPVVEGVLLCGATSANRRRYRTSAFAGDRLKKYEGVKVYVDHGTGRGSRSYADHLGWVENVRLNAQGRPVGDIGVKPGHPLAESFLFDAEHRPGNCGMSHVANCKTTRGKDGWEEVESVESVESVDVVVDPATVKTLYSESQKGTKVNAHQFAERVASRMFASVKQKRAARRLAEALGADADDIQLDPAAGVRDAFCSACMHIIGQALDGELDPKDALAKIKKLISSHGEVNTGTDTDDDTDTDTDDGMPGAFDNTMPDKAESVKGFGASIRESDYRGPVTHKTKPLAPRRPAATRKTSESVPTDGKAFAASIRD